MRPRDQALIALGAFAVLALMVGVAGRSRERRPDTDERPSTFLSGPGGAKALMDALPRLGVSVRRFRERPRELERLQGDGRPVLFILDPSIRYSPPEITSILVFARDADLVVAGRGAEALMKCFGYAVRRRFLDSVPATVPGRPRDAETQWVHDLLISTGQRIVVDSSRTFDVARTSCLVPPMARVDTLLVSPGGRVVAVRLTRADVDRKVILVSDVELFRNRALRHTGAGPFVLGLVAGTYDRVIFEEYHHGFGASGSLAGAVIGWSRRSPWGWLAWQAALVGVLALLFGAIRFGPARSAISRTRRSPLEHLRALATALGAAQGHDVAIAAMVRGLRRRLLPPALRTRGDWRRWLGELGRSTRSPAGRDALARLENLSQPGQPSIAVLRAANAVEDLWEDLRH